MRFAPLVVLGFFMMPLAVLGCDKEKAAEEAGSTQDAEPACDAKKQLQAFFDDMTAGNVDEMTARSLFPFSGDGNRWVDSAEEFKERFDGPRPFESFDIKPLEAEAALDENKTEWLAEVRGRYADVKVFDVSATLEGKEEPMTALWFVDGASCKVVGLDD